MGRPRGHHQRKRMRRLTQSGAIFGFNDYSEKKTLDLRSAQRGIPKWAGVEDGCGKKDVIHQLGVEDGNIVTSRHMCFDHIPRRQLDLLTQSLPFPPSINQIILDHLPQNRVDERLSQFIVSKLSESYGRPNVRVQRMGHFPVESGWQLDEYLGELLMWSGSFAQDPLDLGKLIAQFQAQQEDGELHQPVIHEMERMKDHLNFQIPLLLLFSGKTGGFGICSKIPNPIADSARIGFPNPFKEEGNEIVVYMAPTLKMLKIFLSLLTEQVREIDLANLDPNNIDSNQFQRVLVLFALQQAVSDYLQKSDPNANDTAQD